MDRCASDECALETCAVSRLELNTNAGCRRGLTQIVVLTYPLVGNYGVPDQTLEDVYGEADLSSTMRASRS